MSIIEETANSLIKEFSNDSDTQDKITAIKLKDPFNELRIDLLEFFRDRIAKISKQEDLKNKLEEALTLDLDSGELNFDQKMTLYRAVTSQGNHSIDSLLGLFKPTPGAPSILADNLARPDDKEDIFNDIYENLTSEQLQQVAAMTKVLTMLGKKSDE